MMYLKAIAVGVGSALLAVVLWELWDLLPLFVESARMWWSSDGIGALPPQVCLLRDVRRAVAGAVGQFHIRLAVANSCQNGP
jgi:hypothetical protein